MKLVFTFIIGLTFPISAVQAESAEKHDFSPVHTTVICPVEKSKSLASSSITEFKAKLYKSQSFQLSTRYCLLDRSQAENQDTSFSSSAEYKKMEEGYREVYKSFRSIEEKAAFIDHFLYRVSRQTNVLSARPDSENDFDAAVIFSFKNTNDRTVNLRFSLFEGDSDEEKKQILARLNSFDFPQPANDIVKDSVDYVLGATPLSVYLFTGGYELFSWRDDDNEEFEDDDDPFWDWAWEQGWETCEIMGCDLEWKYDDYYQESYLLFSVYDDETAYYEEWTGYYNPGRHP